MSEVGEDLAAGCYDVAAMVRWMACQTPRPRSRPSNAGSRAAGRGVILAALLSLVVTACRAPSFTDADAASIEAVLVGQRDAWNAGDIDGFMGAYVRGPELVFTSGAAVRRGYDEALARYRAKYVDGGTMGTLAFTDLEVTGLSADAAVVLGRWAVTGTEQAGDGVFSLVLVRRGGAWKILHDHTSATPSP